MFLQSFQRLILISLFFSLPALTYGLPESDVPKFKKDCVMYWMKDSDKASDKAEYKNFGEKYCSCMSAQPLNDDANMKQSAKTCMTQTLLQTTMDNLEEDPGLDSLTQSNIEQGCIKQWDFIGTVLVGDKKGNNSGFCRCAAPKLNDMNAKRDDMTDDQWNSKINSIASDCS